MTLIQTLIKEVMSQYDTKLPDTAQRLEYYINLNEPNELKQEDLFLIAKISNDFDEFKKNMDNWIERFKNAKTITPEQKVIIPGEPEFAEHDRRLKSGIPLNEKVVEDLQSLAKKFNLVF